MDGGLRGLEQSCHHPNAGRSEFPIEAPQPQQSTKKAAKKPRAGNVLQNFIRLEGLISRGISDKELQQVWRMVFPAGMRDSLMRRRSNHNTKPY